MVRSAFLLLTLALASACSGGKDTDDTAAGAGPADDGPLQYKPIVQWEETRFQEFPVRYYVPPNPIGLVWGFHGSEGHVGFANEIETVALLNELILAGFGFVITESTEQTGYNQWNVDSDDPSENEDLARLFALREELIELTDLEPGAPEYAFGFSNGGGMSGVMAKASLEAGFDFRATAPFLSGGNPWGLEIPIFWSVAVNDPQPAAEEEAEQRLEQGLRTELKYIDEYTITPEWFTRNPAVTLETSQKTQSEMVRLGMIDEAGARIVPVEELEEWLTTFEKEAKIGSPTLRTEEIRVAWAMHRMNAYYAFDVRDFFLEQL